MRSAEDIILGPHITEKSNAAIAEGKYTFKVDTRATKTEIKQAVEKLFQVKVMDVRTMNFEGKNKRMGVHEGKTSKWKKAVVKINMDPKPEAYLAKGGKQVANNKKYKTSIDEFGAAQ
jgi:large subunit ribosomal protein L23